MSYDNTQDEDNTYIRITPKGRYYLEGLNAGLSEGDALIYANAKVEGRI